MVIGFIGDVETIMVDKMMDSMERPPYVHPCYRKHGFGITCTPFRSSGRVTLVLISPVLVGSATTRREISLPKNYAA